jgi:hypothetical protein
MTTCAPASTIHCGCPVLTWAVDLGDHPGATFVQGAHRPGVILAAQILRSPVRHTEASSTRLGASVDQTEARNAIRQDSCRSHSAHYAARPRPTCTGGPDQTACSVEARNDNAVYCQISVRRILLIRRQGARAHRRWREQDGRHVQAEPGRRAAGRLRVRPKPPPRRPDSCRHPTTTFRCQMLDSARLCTPFHERRRCRSALLESALRGKSDEHLACSLASTAGILPPGQTAASESSAMVRGLRPFGKAGQLQVLVHALTKRGAHQWVLSKRREEKPSGNPL